MTNLRNNPGLRLLHGIWRVLRHFLPELPKSTLGKRIVIGVLALFVVSIGGMFGIAKWYQWTVRDTPQVLGASFVPAYASSMGVDPQQTLDAMLNDLGIRHLRLVSYWNAIEPTQGAYNFDELDWQFEKAEAAGAKITLSLGLRQPRWPECHPPSWVDTSKPREQWQPALEDFMTAVVTRYKDSPALQNYQVENEFFLKAFGECQNFDRQRLIDEYNLVKKLDPTREVIITRSNNGIGIPLYGPKADRYGVSVYKRVWDSGLTKRYLEYPQPAWYYSFMAGVQKMVQGRDMNVHELQAEAWAPKGKFITDISLEEQNKSLDGQRLADRFEYGRATGLRTVDLWGAEYWYYRKQILNDSSLWDAARDGFRR